MVDTGDWIKVSTLKWRSTKAKRFRTLHGYGDEAVKPDGARFIVVYLEVRGVGRTTETVSASSIALIDQNRGRVYEPDEKAQYNARSDYLISEQLHPGTTISVKTAFDVPDSAGNFVLAVAESGSLLLSGADESDTGYIYVGDWRYR
jgi:hypothetical protein